MLAGSGRVIWRDSTRRRARCGSKSDRRGAAAVEFAVIAPLIFVLLFAGIEFGRVLMAYHGLDEAAREGCRQAIAWNATQEDVEQTVGERLASFGIAGYTLSTDPSDLSGVSQWDPVSVRIDVPYGQVSWLPVPRYLQGITLTGSCTLPQESNPDDF